ncbi:unnamed protein product [Pleuronectes platessa]|uniref:Uncharacterized protein n=1 Tax=Pleuronectes platessa TaxID=8262 RepID=A0A9N7TK05_PLEPL|nr:unnamed protein product [Pleuronectes platessa]
MKVSVCYRRTWSGLPRAVRSAHAMTPVFSPVARYKNVKAAHTSGIESYQTFYLHNWREDAAPRGSGAVMLLLLMVVVVVAVMVVMSSLFLCDVRGRSDSSGVQQPLCSLSL